MKHNHPRRGGLVSRLKLWLKKSVRKVVVKRWFIIAVLKAASWLIKRLWSDEDHTDLFP